jgi:hypothetical protein
MDATLVWIAPDAPDASQDRAISSLAVARDLRLVLPPDDGPPPMASAAGQSVAGEVETLMDRAHDDIVARDADGVDRALAAAESTLRAHAELPQAAWLMAEVERCRAARWSRLPYGDAEAADRSWKRADALDGGRVPGLVERESASRPAPATLRLGFADSVDLQAWLDGKPVTTTVESLAGVHALVLTWAGAPVWAEWIEAPAGSSSVDVDLPFPLPCSRADVTRVRVEGDTVHAPDVRCPRWVAALPGRRTGEVTFATCEAARCGPLLDWQPPGQWTTPPAPASRTVQEHDASRGWPAWARWTAVGAGAAIVAGAAVILVEGLRPAPVETRFVYAGTQRE